MIDLANVLVERDFDVDLIVFSATGHYSNQLDPRIRIVSLNARRITFSLFPLMRYLRESQPGTLLALNEHIHLLAISAKFLAGVSTRVVLRMGTMLSHISATRHNLRDGLIAPLSRLLYPFADAVIAVSQGVAHDVITHYGVSREVVTVIYNPKNVTEILEKASQLVIHPWFTEPRDIPIIVAVGRFRVQKGFADLIEAFAVLQRDVDSRLLIVGEGREQPILENLILKLGIKDKVSFVGYQENPHAYVARADVFAMTSLWEGLPNSLIEALICGKPVVVTDCDSGPREILAPATNPLLRISSGIEWTPCGALVPVGSCSEITLALRMLLTDNALRSASTRAATERGGDFAAAPIIEQYLQVLLG
jgi:glycosyltransferase involved in cell wall biosynthesis